MYHIFITEDDEKIAGAVQAYLTRYGYKCTVARDFLAVQQEIAEASPHLVILDVNLPFQDGFHLCQAIRRRSAVPILFLSARAGDMDQVRGMESGGDDYITKPFALEVLLAKVKALLRRAYGEYAPGAKQTATLQVGILTLDLAAAEMRLAPALAPAPPPAQPLTRNELKLLHLLMERAGQVVSRELCLEALWDDSSFVDDNTLTVNVTRLKNKLDLWGLKEAVETRRGLGYRLAPERLEAAP
ncbi:MAG: two component transcriptional regulator, winged helix family [Symbiobacteriaceae bacterium]|jgi:DNA-binding response OmpR family regulator|nr:two component transcriptional regulator, winged helix family [Symbiobacteriaceae bacterium]